VHVPWRTGDEGAILVPVAITGANSIGIAFGVECYYCYNRHPHRRITREEACPLEKE
jgi:hypothetical protein